MLADSTSSICARPVVRGAQQAVKSGLFMSPKQLEPRSGHGSPPVAVVQQVVPLPMHWPPHLAVSSTGPVRSMQNTRLRQVVIICRTV